MATYVIAYDLHKRGQNYNCIISRIKAYKNWCHLQGSVWLVRTERSAAQVRDNLCQCLDQNDNLFVAKLEGEMAWFGYSSEISRWIKEAA